ncbi:hypothetical protein [Streptomyces sp. NBC_00239]|uniref:hypothetical protein n=1 Tax=Streptomyces sp. NBC_00239 TaxID=2903640 RepID=UPI002E296E2B|nr:hypothetical protein [Streptomyces sp. NBC_00239]
MTVEPSDFVKRLPIGEQIPLPADGIPFWEVFPYDGDVRIKVLDEPVLPEPPREGDNGTDCHGCSPGEGRLLWSDEHWQVHGFPQPEGLPALVMLLSKEHFDLHEMPSERAVELGAMIQRAERAVLSLGGIARVHVNRYGDGSSHLHFWLMARPEGMLQMRGTCLPLWGDVLPKPPLEEWRETNRRIAHAMAADGGTAHV